jgi:hypothetical protein
LLQYKGKWVHPEIDNPEYKADDELYLHEDLGVVAFDLWQVKSGTIFDNLLITDSVEEAKAHAADTYEPLHEAEKKEKEKFEAEEKARLEEEEKKRKVRMGRKLAAFNHLNSRKRKPTRRIPTKTRKMMMQRTRRRPRRRMNCNPEMHSKLGCSRSQGPVAL